MNIRLVPFKSVSERHVGTHRDPSLRIELAVLARRACTVGLLCSCVVVGSSRADPLATQLGSNLSGVVAGDLGARLDDYLSRARAFGFSGQVVAEKDGQIVLRKAYGTADRERNIAMTLDTPLGIASLSKSFAAAAILKLMESGRLKLSDPIDKYIADIPADKKQITIQQLVTHTAGLRGGGADDFEAASSHDAVAAVLQRPLFAEPGAKWRYASEAYVLVASIVAKASGMSYEDYVRTALFIPAGMTASGFLSDPKWKAAGVSHAYQGWSDTGSPALWPANFRVQGGGDIVSTADDLYRWDLALRSGKVLSSATVSLYMTPQVQIQGDHYYAYGLFVHKNFPLSSTRKTLTIEHGGDTELGFNSAYFRFPEEKALFIVTSNSRDYLGRSLRQAVDKNIQDILLGVAPVAVPPASRPMNDYDRLSLPGTYSVDGQQKFSIIDDGAYLWVAAKDENAANLLSNAKPTVVSQIGLGSQKTAKLLAGLVAHNPQAAYQVAMQDAHLPASEAEGLPTLDEFVQEWDRLIKAHGQLKGYQTLGGYVRGDIVWVVTRLNFSTQDLPMSFAWRDGAQGRLGDTEPHLAPPLAIIYPLAIGEDGDLVAYDLFRGATMLRIRRSEPSGRLEWLFPGSPEPFVMERKLTDWFPLN